MLLLLLLLVVVMMALCCVRDVIKALSVSAADVASHYTTSLRHVMHSDT